MAKKYTEHSTENINLYKTRNVFIIGAKSIGQYGGYETFLDKLTEIHQNEKSIQYYIVTKSNGDGAMDETKLSGVTNVKKNENGEVRSFRYHSANVVKLQVPQVGAAQAIIYDVKAFKWCLSYIKRHQIEDAVIYVLACRIGPFFGRLVRKAHKLGAEVQVNPDGHEWMRAKWSAPIRKYWKTSEKMMVKHADLLICDSVNIEKYIKSEYSKYNPKTTYIAYGADIRKSSLADDDPKFVGWLQEHDLQLQEYYMCCGRFVPENSFEIMIREFTHPNSHPYDSGLIFTDGNGAVSSWLTKEDVRPEFYKNRVNAGLHVIDPKALDMLATEVNADDIGREVDGKIVKVDLDRQVLKPLCGSGRMFAYDSPEYVKDMGTPETFYAVSKDFENGTVKAKNLQNKQKAIFLDRDGTINKYVGFLRDISDFELLDGVAEAVKLINVSGYLAIVVTNQPVIARGEVSYEELEQIHNKMETLLGASGAYIDGLYFCPHHPDKGFEGEVPELKFDCECRKPKPGMLLKAAEDYNIDLANSYMIGDGKNDVLAGKAAGCKSVLIGEGEFDQDMSVGSLLEAVEKIVMKQV